MSSVPVFGKDAARGVLRPVGAPDSRSALLPWLPIGAGLLALYVPTFWDVSQVFWSQERGSSGPVVLAIAGWLAWRQRAALKDPADRPATFGGAALLVIGLSLYALGRSQQFFQFEVASLVPVFAGCLLLMRGTFALRQMWFPLVFLLLVVPLPGSLLDALLIPLKQQVSVVVTTILHYFGFPVARTGVVLSIGQYQLLIADACSGLSSMIALSGIGLLYIHLAGHAGWLRNALLLASVLPIAFLSNVIRVIVLMLGTYWFGDAIGHMLHNQMQYAQMLLAFGMFFLADWLLVKRLSGPARRKRSPHPSHPPIGATEEANG